MDRRTFLGTSTLIAGSGALARAPRAAPADPPMIGIQVGAVSFVDEGTDKVLDGFQELAAINTLFLATFTYGRGIAGRQLRSEEHTSELQSQSNLVCRLLLEKKKIKTN